MDTDSAQDWLALNAHLALLHKPSRAQMAQPPPSASVPSSNDVLQTHLYSAFLTRSLPDIALNVQGRSWHAVYHLHKVVLIQAVCLRPTSIRISHLTRAGLFSGIIHWRLRGELARRRRGRRRTLRYEYYPGWYVYLRRVH